MFLFTYNGERRKQLLRANLVTGHGHGDDGGAIVFPPPRRSSLEVLKPPLNFVVGQVIYFVAMTTEEVGQLIERCFLLR